MILLFFEGGGGVTPIIKSPIIILLTNGKLAMKVGARIYQEL